MLLKHSLSVEGAEPCKLLNVRSFICGCVKLSVPACLKSPIRAELAYFLLSRFQLLEK
jgi:hypothetical protein